MEKIVVSNEENFEKLKQRIKEQGTDNILIVADFNKTLTHAFVDGKKVSTSFANIRDNNYLGEEYINKAKKYFEKYHPIEVSRDISFEEKDKAMQEWWRKHFEILIEYGITNKVFLEIIEKGKVKLRKGVKDFFKWCKEKNIPFVIISSGLGDFIPEMLKKEEIFFDNVYIYANMFRFDSEGNAIGIGERIIHTANKKITNVGKIEFYSEVKDKKNLVLLGDDLTDLRMSESFDYDNIIKIGFLNEKVDIDLSLYKENFDILILNDGDFQPVSDLIKDISK
jgi:HAD superfamily hydrolase (TIGR01544 family)